MMLSAMIQKQIIAGIFRLLIPALLCSHSPSIISEI